MSNLTSAIKALENKTKEKAKKDLNATKEALIKKAQQQTTQPYPNPTCPWRSKESRLKPFRKELSDLIKTERKNQGLSQRALARLSGYSQATITRAETRLWVSLDCLILLAEALGKKLSF